MLSLLVVLPGGLKARAAGRQSPITNCQSPARTCSINSSLTYCNLIMYGRISILRSDVVPVTGGWVEPVMKTRSNELGIVGSVNLLINTTTSDTTCAYRDMVSEVTN